MAEKDNNNAGGMTAERAMNVVLQAEADARQAVEQCSAQADILLQQAREKAQRIAAHTDDRISRLHRRCHRAVTDQVSQLQLEQERNLKASLGSEPDPGVVDDVAGQMAALLTTLDELEVSAESQMPDKKNDVDAQ
jgi:vacuolar-type H+-ATPase subunit H